MKKIERCLICCHDDMYVCKRYDNFGIEYNYIFCNTCKTSFANEHAEESESKTIDWYNAIAGDCR